MHPNEAKRLLARSVVSLYWGQDAALAAQEKFDLVFREGGIPHDVPEHVLSADDPVNMPSLIRELFEVSGSEARRLLDQGAVRIEGSPCRDQDVPRDRLAGKVLKVGKRRFARLSD
jgi:tyrosyl-tRNA synthetase